MPLSYDIAICCYGVRIDLLQMVFNKFVRLVAGWSRPPLTYDEVNKVLVHVQVSGDGLRSSRL